MKHRPVKPSEALDLVRKKKPKRALQPHVLIFYRRAARLFLTGKNPTQVAKDLDVSRGRILKLARDRRFLSELDKMEKFVSRRADHKLVSLYEEGIDVLRKLQQHWKPSIQLRAIELVNKLRAGTGTGSMKKVVDEEEESRILGPLTPEEFQNTKAILRQTRRRTVTNMVPDDDRSTSHASQGQARQKDLTREQGQAPRR